MAKSTKSKLPPRPVIDGLRFIDESSVPYSLLYEPTAGASADAVFKDKRVTVLGGPFVLIETDFMSACE